MPPRTTPKSIYKPRVGELVKDGRTGRIGVYQCPGFGKHPTVYLRPEGGGVEWECPASEVEPFAPADELGPIRPGDPRCRLAGKAEP